MKDFLHKHSNGFFSFQARIVIYDGRSDYYCQRLTNFDDLVDMKAEQPHSHSWVIYPPKNPVSYM